MAQPPTRAIAIDPAPVLEGSIPALATLFQVESDEFFAFHSLPAVLGAEAFYLAFVDGSHLSECVLRDFASPEKSSSARSVVLLHDCIPLDSLTSERTRSTFFYTGDVWKTVLYLRRRRSDPEMRIVPTPPSRLCLVRGLNREARASTRVLSGIAWN